MSTQMVVCSIYELNMRNGEYTKDGKVLVRSNIALERGYVEEKNGYWTQNGLWHEIDNKKTSEFYKKAGLGELVEDIDVNDAEEVLIEDAVVEEEKVDVSKLLAGDLRVKYLDKYGKDVPNNKKNDKEWIYKKINA